MGKLTATLTGAALLATTALSPAHALERTQIIYDAGRMATLDDALALVSKDGAPHSYSTYLGQTSTGMTVLYVVGGLVLVGGIVALAASGGGSSSSDDGNSPGDGDGGGSTPPQDGDFGFGRDGFPGQTAAPSSFATNEYNRSRTLAPINASSAYARGADGTGVVIAIIDSEFDETHPEYTGRIHPASQRLFSSGIALPSTGERNHGTGVANVALGAKNDIGTHGVAYDATIMGLGIAPRGVDSQISNGNIIAEALAYAADNGARIANMSYSSTAGPSYSGPNSTYNAAYNKVIANDMLLTVAAGNSGGGDPSTAPSHDPVYKPALAPHMIVAVGLDTNTGSIASGSDRCGLAQDWCMAAPAWDIAVMSYDRGDRNRVYSPAAGTSYAAPVIAGAAALVMETWPTMTAPQVQALLFASADDAGLPGVDGTYGHGILNLARAFDPNFTQQSAQSQSTGAAMTPDSGALIGDGSSGVAVARALGAQDIQTIDSFGRSFSLPLASVLDVRMAERRLADAISTQLDSVSARAHIAGGKISGGLHVLALNDGMNQSLSFMGDGFALHSGHAAANIITKTREAPSPFFAASLADYAMGDKVNSFMRLDGGNTSLLAVRGEDGRALLSGTTQLSDSFSLGTHMVAEKDALLGLQGNGAFQIEGRSHAVSMSANYKTEWNGMGLSFAAEYGRFGFDGDGNSFVQQASGTLVAAHAMAVAPAPFGVGGTLKTGVALPMTPVQMTLDSNIRLSAGTANFSAALEPRAIVAWNKALMNDAVKFGLMLDQSTTRADDGAALIHLNVNF